MTRVRFGEFELEPGAGELRRGASRVPIPEQPLRLLEMLVGHPGVIVSREQLRERLWPADTFVDFEHGLNAAVKRLRDALGDSADQPRFIETVPKRGYRFIATVESARLPAADRSAGARSVARRRLLVAVAVALLGITWWLAWRRADRESSPAPSRLTRLTFDRGLQTDPAFSPDGRFLAYASNASGNFDIWIVPLDGDAPTRLTDDPAHDRQPDWSPDGRWILFRSERDGGGLFAISPADRHVTRLTSSGFNPRWSPDGRRFAFGSGVFFSGTSFVASADGTNITPMARQDEPGALNQAMGWHPRGQLVWLRGRAAGISMVSRRGAADAVRASLIPGDVRRRFDLLTLGVMDNQRLVWSADGRTLNFVGDAHGVIDIWQLSVDPDDLDVTGGPVRITTGSEAELAVARAPGGGLAFSETTRTMRAWTADLDATGRTVAGSGKAVTAESVSASEPALSPDGGRLVVRVTHPGGDRRPELREISLESGAERVLRTIDTAHEDVRYPRWSPDGRRLAYSYRYSSHGGFGSAIKMLDVGSSQESFVTSLWTDGTPALENPWGWSADGGSVLVTSTRYRRGVFAVARVPLSAAPRGEAAARVLVAADNQGVWQATESPNGQWVCYNATPHPGAESSVLYIVSANGGNPRRLLDSTSWDDKPRWSSDGRLLYFLSLREGELNVWAVNVDPGKGVAVGTPFRVTHFESPADTIPDHIGSADISVGGSRLALLVERLAGGIWVLR